MEIKAPEIRLEAPRGATEVLLHACCAPCATAIVECLMTNDIRPTLFYFNPNIFPDSEYEKRKKECIHHTQLLGLHFVDADYNHTKWLEAVQGLESEPERGARCMLCFQLRLKATALYAAEHGFRVFTTTLATSRWKDIRQIHAAGEWAAALFPDLVYWTQNWRKGGLSERRNNLIRMYGLYNQSYCGCEFSMRKEM